MAGLKEKFLGKAKSIGLGLGVGVVTVGAIIGGIVESGTSTSAYSGDWSSYTDLGDYIVKIDEAGAMPALTKSELKEAIDKCYTGKAHDNYISELDSFISMQSKYKVNAAFAVCVAQTESTGGTGWDLIDSSTYNWYSIQGSAGGGYVDRNGTSWNKYSSFSDANDGFGSLISENYFPTGKISVETVGVMYCNPPTQWSNSVKLLLDKMYATVAPEGGSFNGDVYKNAGKTYKLFNQHNYQDSFAGGTIDQRGCGVTSVAIIVSAYKDGETPPSIAKSCEPKYGNTVNPKYGYVDPNGVFHRYLGDYGLTCKEYEGFNGDNIINHLKSGKAVIFNYSGTLTINEGSGYYTDGHFTTFLGINGDNIFVGDPAGVSGETTMAKIMATNCKRYFLVDKK